MVRHLMKLPSGRSRRLAAAPALLVWALLVLGVYNLGARHAEYEATVRDFLTNGFQLDGENLGRAVRMYLTDDGDVRRYYAYANALLGRPYYAYFVRSAAQWQAEFAAPSTSSPDDWPLRPKARPLVPYRDYLIEYPPGLLLFTVPPALLLPSGDYGDLYRLLFCSEMAVLLGLAAWLGLRARAQLGEPGQSVAPARRFFWLCALGALLLGPIATHRYDAVVAVLLCLTAWAALSGRLGLAGGALMLAVASKGVPLLVAPIWVAYVWLRPAGQGSRTGLRAVARALGWAVLSGAALVTPILWWCGAAPLQALRYHTARPLQLESTGAALLGLVPAFVPALRESLKVVSTYGSWNVVAVGPALAGLDAVLQRLSTGLLGAGILAVYAATLWRLRGLRPERDGNRLTETGAPRAKPEPGTLTALEPRARAPRPPATPAGDSAATLAALEPRACARRPLVAMGECALRAQVAVLVLYMVLGKVFSPQYVIWLLPLGFVVALRERRLLVLLLVAMALTQVIHPISYAALKRAAALGVWAGAAAQPDAPRLRAAPAGRAAARRRRDDKFDAGARRRVNSWHASVEEGAGRGSPAP